MPDGINVDIERNNGEEYIEAWKTMWCNHIYGNELCRSECLWCIYY